MNSGRWDDTAAGLVRDRAKWRTAADSRYPGPTEKEINEAVRLLTDIEEVSNEEATKAIAIAVLVHSMHKAGATRAQIGYEETSPRADVDRAKRYTGSGIREDLKKIRNAARRGWSKKLRTYLEETSHTVRFYLSRQLKVDQTVVAILTMDSESIASTCDRLLMPSAVQTRRPGRPVDEVQDRLLLSVVHIYENLVGKPRLTNWDGRDTPFMSLVKLSYELAGEPRAATAIKSRFADLRPRRGAPKRLSRFGPAVLIAKKAKKRNNPA